MNPAAGPNLAYRPTTNEHGAACPAQPRPDSSPTRWPGHERASDRGGGPIGVGAHKTSISCANMSSIYIR
jgi:hypothetical protein